MCSEDQKCHIRRAQSFLGQGSRMPFAELKLGKELEMV